MMRLLFPKWFASEEAKQTPVRDYDEEYYEDMRIHRKLVRENELRRYKDCSIEELAEAFGMLHLTDQNHTENITLVPEGVKMTFRYYNIESGDKACTAVLHDRPQDYDEKIYGERKTAKVEFFIGDDVAIYPALKIAVAELMRQRAENKEQYPW
jgi:hypothetical protein